MTLLETRKYSSMHVAGSCCLIDPTPSSHWGSGGWLGVKGNQNDSPIVMVMSDRKLIGDRALNICEVPLMCKTLIVHEHAKLNMSLNM